MPKVQTFVKEMGYSVLKSSRVRREQKLIIYLGGGQNIRREKDVIVHKGELWKGGV